MVERGTPQRQTTRFPRNYGWSDRAVVGVVLFGLAYVMCRALVRTTSARPPAYYVQQALFQIELGLNQCTAETGTAPKSVEELPQLLDKYIHVSDRSNLLVRMITSGKDYWGHPLQIAPIANEPGRYSLRSLGTNGVLDPDGLGDDLIVTYSAGSRAESNESPPVNK